MDYQIEFCRLCGRHSTDACSSCSRPPFVEQRRGQEQDKVKKQLEAMGVNWTPPPANAPKGVARVQAEIKVPRTQAGGTLDMSITAHNTGTAPIWRLRAYTKSEDSVLDRREFVFGALQPGEKRTWTVP
jgi:carboxyl-terminal processing protease